MITAKLVMIDNFLLKESYCGNFLLLVEYFYHSGIIEYKTYKEINT